MSSLLRQFIRYVLPNTAGMLGLSCYILADTFFVARGLGADGLAALNLALPVYNLLNGAGLMAAMGGGARYAILRAQNDTQAARRCFTRTLRLAAALVLPFFLAGLFFIEPLCTLLGARGQIHSMACSYLRLILLFSPLFVLNTVLSAFARNDGAPSRAMAAMLTGSAANIVMDYIFIFPMQLGIAGAAAATCAAPLLGILILSGHIFSCRCGFSPAKAAFKPTAATAIASAGLSAFVNEAAGGLVMLAFNTVILRIAGSGGVAAYGVVANLAQVVTAMLTGIAQGVQPLVSHAFGSGALQDLRRLCRWGEYTAVALAAAVCAAVLPLAGQIAALFVGRQDELLLLAACRGLRLYFPGFLFTGYSILTSACLSAVGQGRAAFAVSICRGALLSLPALLIGAALGQMTGVWLSMPIVEFLTWIFAFFLRKKADLW